MKAIHRARHGEEWGAQSFHALFRHTRFSQHLDIFTNPKLSKPHHLRVPTEAPLHKHDWPLVTKLHHQPSFLPGSQGTFSPTL